MGHWYRRRKGESNTQEGSSSVSGSRLRSRRLGAILATALFTIALVPGLATAANSRDLFIGTPVLTADTDGIISPTPVSRPLGADVHSTYVQVGILSNDNQTLAHTVLTVRIPTPTGLTVHDPFDPGPSTTDADPCTPSFDTTNKVTTITCNYDSLEAFGERTIAMVIDVASTFVIAGQASPFISAQATTNNENGQNLQHFDANSGAFQVQDFSANHLDSWVPNGTHGKAFSTAALGESGAGKLSSTISFDTSANETISLTDGTTVQNGKYQCPAAFPNCQSDFSEAVTATGSFTSSPYFTWTVNALVPKTYSLSQGFVAHYVTGQTDPDWILLFKSRASFCGSLEITSNGHCIKTLTLDKYDKTNNKLTLVLVMNHQGGLKY